MEYQTLVRRWLAKNGVPGEIIAQRVRGDQYSVVLDSGPNIYIPLVALDALDIPELEPKPPPKRRARRKRRKANG